MPPDNRATTPAVSLTPAVPLEIPRTSAPMVAGAADGADGRSAPETQPRAAPAAPAVQRPAAVAVREERPESGAAVGEPAAPEGPRTTCTTAQLRRFIKSRPWVPMHELRRRFGIWGGDDDVTPIRVGAHTLYIGLPPAEGGMVGELLAAGDVGYELSLDPEAPIVVGVYPMRPVPRS